MNQTLTDIQDFASSIRSKTSSSGQADELKLDPHFEEDPGVSKVIEFAIKRRKNLLLVGPTGCGKSSLAIQVSARLKERLEIVSLDGETSTDHVIGKPWIIQENGQTVTKMAKGAVLRAYSEGKGVLLEEVDMAQADILASVHRILETQSKFYVSNIGEQEIFPRHRDFFTIATANTIGTGEDTFMYSGTKPLNQAFMNRFSLTVLMDYLPADKEKKVIVAKTGIDPDLAEQLVASAGDVRQARTSATDRIASTVSTRDLLEWADAILGLGLTPMEAAWFAFLNRINEADRDIIKTFIENRVR